MPRAVGIRTTQPIADLVAEWPEATHTRVFVNGVLGIATIHKSLRELVYDAIRPTLEAGLIPVVSFKLTPNEVMLGHWGQQLDSLAEWLGTLDSHVMVIPWHEPEGALTPQEFTGMFSRVRSHLSRSLNVSVGYAAMAYQWMPHWRDAGKSVNGKTDDPNAWMVVADFYGVDMYSGNTQPLTAIVPEHKGFKRWVDLYVPNGAPIHIIERGFIASEVNWGIRAEAIRREAEWFNQASVLAQRVRTYLAWSSPGQENNPNNVLDARGKEAMHELFHAFNPPTYEQGYDQGFADGYTEGTNSLLTSMRTFLDGYEHGA